MWVSFKNTVKNFAENSTDELKVIKGRGRTAFPFQGGGGNYMGTPNNNLINFPNHRKQGLYFVMLCLRQRVWEVIKKLLYSALFQNNKTIGQLRP